MKSVDIRYSRLVAALSLALALAVTGCGTLGGGNFAGVTIKGHSKEEIAQMTLAVFREDGFSGGSLGGGRMVFQKGGSAMNNIAYAGVVGSYYGAQTIVRVKTELFSDGKDSHRLECQAYIVTDAGDSFFEEEKRLANVRRGPYQTLLDKVADRLK